MSKKLWIGLILVVIASWVGLKPHFAPLTHDADTATHTRPAAGHTIRALTDAQRVATWIRQHQQLPDYYLTKSEARQRGWNASAGNLRDVLPGHAIGGDRFSNREKRLPEKAGRRWYEADVNYQCGRRNADRLLYSSDGQVFLTTDHYRHVREIH